MLLFLRAPVLQKPLARYSTFLDAVKADQVEKVSFAADGKQVLAIDKDGNHHESLILATLKYCMY